MDPDEMFHKDQVSKEPKPVIYWQVCCRRITDSETIYMPFLLDKGTAQHRADFGNNANNGYVYWIVPLSLA